jgi:hypothetical protein
MEPKSAQRPPRVLSPFIYYRLPDDRLVAVDRQLAKGQEKIDYTFADGTIVTAIAIPGQF